MDGEAVQDVLYSTAIGRGLKPNRAFAAVYKVLIGKSIGSKAGLGMLPFGLSTDTRGAMPLFGRRNKPMVEMITQDGSSIMKLDGGLPDGPYDVQ